MTKLKNAHENIKDDSSIILGNYVGELKAKNKALLEATLSYQELCTCYRLGRRPSEKLFAKLKKADKLLGNM